MPFTWATRLALTLLLWLLSSQTGAAPPLSLEASQGRVPLTGQVALYRDLSGALSLDAVLRQTGPQDFQTPPGTLASGYMTGALWLRFTLARPAGAPARWWLEADGFAERIELYVPRPEGGYEHRTGGADTPPSQKEVHYRNALFILELPAATPQTYYARIPIDASRRLRLVAWQPEHFQPAAARETLLQGAYFGMMLLLVALNLGYWIWQRAPLHGYYALSVLMLLIYFFIFEGYFNLHFEVAPGHSSPLARMASWIWLAAHAALLSSLLALGRHMPRADRMLCRLTMGLALFALVTNLTGQYIPFADFMNLARLGVVLASLVLPLMLLRRGVREAATYLLGFGFLLLGVILISLEQHGQVLAHWNWMSDHFLQAATLPHVIIMHLMVARRFEALKAERLQAERKLRMQEARLRDQTQFLSLLAHEIVNPLAVVDGAAQLLQLSGQADPRPIEQIRKATSRMADLLKNCLTSERIGDAGWQVNFVCADIGAIVRAACDAHPSPFHTIHCQLDGLPERIQCDGALIRVLLDNLLENAIKYSPEGGDIEVRGWRDADTLVLEITDQGVGIPADQQEKVFQRFYRTRQVADAPGAGLGLHMVRRIAQLHGGKVTCASIPGQGTRMTVRLPIA